MQFLGFGNGSDGSLSISSNTTDSPVDSGCSGTAGTTSLTATNASFTAGDIILIHQSRGTGVGAWELNQIASYVAGTITTVLKLANTYIDSGASQAQVLVVKQYSSVTVDSGKTLSVKAWNGNVGGILAYMCNGMVTVTGTISANSCGFRGGNNDSEYSYKGEGTVGASFRTTSEGTGYLPNGNGGGGAANACGGGGGGNGAAGTAGQSGGEGGTGIGGYGGYASGTADLTTMTFGGGGAGGSNLGIGGAAGGIIFIAGMTIAEITGLVSSNGAGGGTGGAGGAGGGAGGSILLKTQTATLGTTRVTATAGSGGSGSQKNGGAGGVGRIRIEACSIIGSTSPAASEVEGGQDWCGAVAQMLEG